MGMNVKIYFKVGGLKCPLLLYGGQMNIFNNLILFIIAFDVAAAFTIYKVIYFYRNR